jgi:hypothetical protein
MKEKERNESQPAKPQLSDRTKKIVKLKRSESDRRAEKLPLYKRYHIVMQQKEHSTA